MNKKIILLPFLAVALLTGCGNKKEVKPWEEELTEGESTFAQVKAGTVGEYYKVRGTVVWNSGSTTAIYRNGEFLYCYNFNTNTEKTGNEDLGEHKLGSYVEIYAQSSAYSGSIQLTAYPDGYDVDAKCLTIAEVGETVNPVVVSDPANLVNANAGTLAKIELVADADYTIPSTALSSDLYMNFKMTDSANTALAVKVEKFLPAEDIANLAGTINQGDKLEIVGMLAATSSGNCRMVLGQGSSYTVTEAKVWAEPTGVTVTSAGDATSVKVNETLQLSATVAPAEAKQKVTWSSSDETKATVSASGKVTGVATGDVVITATAKEGVSATFNVTVTAAATNYTLAATLSFNKNTDMVVNDEISASKRVTYSDKGVTLLNEQNKSSTACNLWLSTYTSVRLYAGSQDTISYTAAFKKVVISYDSAKYSFSGTDNEPTLTGASFTQDTEALTATIILDAEATSLVFVLGKQCRVNKIEVYTVAK